MGPRRKVRAWPVDPTTAELGGPGFAVQVDASSFK